MTIQFQFGSSYKILLANVMLMTVLAGCSTASTDPCLNPQNIGDAKRSSQNDPGTCNGRLCDSYITQGIDQWYRLDGDSTGLRMPESCVQVWHCGTYIPIWLNGAHPTSDSPGPKPVQVCAQKIHSGDCCAWSDYINVKRCSDSSSREYFVYQLKTVPFCDMAYCAGIGQYCPGDSSFNSLTGNCTSPKYPVLPTDAPTLSAPYISSTKTVTVGTEQYTATRFSINCTLRHTRQAKDDGTRYEVIFEADGAFVAGYTLTPTDDTTVVLDESKLAGFLDRKLKCKVTSYWMSEYPVRPSYISSLERYIGIQVIEVLASGGTRTVDNNQPLSLTEGLRNTIRFQATFPITSRACYDSPSSSTCNPTYQFRLSNKGIKMSTCKFQFSPVTAVSANLVVSPTYTLEAYGTYYGSMSIAVENSIQAEGSIFKGYQSPQMTVTITDTFPPVQCSSTGDPHYSTFGNSKFHVYLVNDHYLVRMPERNFEIQTRMVPCNYGAPYDVSCNCGIMAREGNNILGVNFCNKNQPEYIRYLYDNDNPGGNISTTPGSSTIRLLSGVEIRVDIWDTKWLNIYVTGLGIEARAYGGICSYVGDNIQCTDQCNIPNSYRVPDGQSLFNFTSKEPPQCVTRPIIPACDCSDNVPCFIPDQSNLKLTEYTCPTGRKKRDGNGNQNPDFTTTDIDQLFSPITFDLNFGTRVISLTWPTFGNHIPKDAAQSKCESSLRMSPAYDFCINTVRLNTTHIVETCMYDIQLIDSIDFAEDSIAKCLETECGIQINNFIAINYNDTAVKELPGGLKEVLCPHQCSQRGRCNNGGCVCGKGYMDIDCAIQQGAVPQIMGIQNSPCNIQSSTCLKAIISKHDVLTKGSFCKIKNAAGYVYYDTEPVVTDGWVYCSLLPTPVGNRDQLAHSATNYTLSISISNDNKTYSNELTFFVYDGLCINCSNASICTQKTTACNIMGRCYEPQTELPCKIGDVRSCNPDICANKWTYATSHSCKEGIDGCSSVLNSARKTASGYLFAMACSLLFILTSSFIEF